MKLIFDACFSEHAWHDHILSDEGGHSKKNIFYD